MKPFIRDLKYVKFVLNRESNTIVVINKRTEKSVSLNKTYAFSLMRFLVSASQKMAQKNRGKK
jgi:hypothetical protein